MFCLFYIERSAVVHAWLWSDEHTTLQNGKPINKIPKCPFARLLSILSFMEIQIVCTTVTVYYFQFSSVLFSFRRTSESNDLSSHAHK